MVISHTEPEDFQMLHSSIKELSLAAWNWKGVGVVFGLIGGLVTPILGSMVTVVSWFSDPAWHGVSLHQAGTGLFFLVIPLLILGAHCLDLIDQEKKRASKRDPEKQDSCSEEGETNDLARSWR
jgi:hypothetical protein